MAVQVSGLGMVLWKLLRAQRFCSWARQWSWVLAEVTEYVVWYSCLFLEMECKCTTCVSFYLTVKNTYLQDGILFFMLWLALLLFLVKLEDQLYVCGDTSWDCKWFNVLWPQYNMRTYFLLLLSHSIKQAFVVQTENYPSCHEGYWKKKNPNATLYNFMRSEQWLFNWWMDCSCVCVYLSLSCTKFEWKKVCIVTEK